MFLLNIVLICYWKSFFFLLILKIFGTDIKIWWYKYSLGWVFNAFFLDVANFISLPRDIFQFFGLFCV